MRRGSTFRPLPEGEECDVCGEDNTVYPADDAPPFVTLLVVGHLLIPLIWWVERTWHPEIWVHFAIWLPLVVAMTVAALPFVKGAVIGYCWATGIRRHGAFD